MKNRDLFRIKLSLEGLNEKELPIDCSISVAKNLRTINQEIEVINQAVPYSTKEYQERYQVEVNKLTKEYCNKDENGNPIITKQGDSEVLTFEGDGRKLMEDALAKLNESEEMKAILDREEKQLKKRQEALDRETDIVLETIKKDELPQPISPALIEPILDLII